MDKNFISQRKESWDQINSWVPSCRQCKQLEDSGQQSLRQTWKHWVDPNDSTYDAYTIDIRLDTHCNAACVMCSPDSSSLWDDEIQSLAGNKKTINLDHGTIDQNIDKIYDHVDLDKVRYIKFFGGEPLYTRTHIKFIERLPNPQNITLHYTTNASIYPSDHVKKLWEKFKVIIFAASIDGIESQFDYLRWPLKWHTVSDNLIRLRDNSHNVMFRIEFTANLLNALYYDRVEQWVAHNLACNFGGDMTEINIHPCEHSSFNLRDTPLLLREIIKTRYGSDHKLYKLINQYPNIPNLTRFNHFVDKWDTHRNISWKTCFPDIVDYLKS